MSETKTKILLELPTEIVRGAKADAALSGLPVKEWWAEAGRARLREREREEPVGAE